MKNTIGKHSVNTTEKEKVKNGEYEKNSMVRYFSV